jgi:TolA-binding protein
MAARARRASARTADPSGGNVLFTLGLVSVVALLIVGYVMTNGGGTDVTKKNPIISIDPTPAPTIVVIDNTPTGGDVGTSEIMMSQLQNLKEKVDTLTAENQNLTKQMEEDKKLHTREMQNLRAQLSIMKDENAKLSKQISGAN